MPPHKPRTTSGGRHGHGHHGLHSRSSSATRLPGTGAGANINLQLTQKETQQPAKLPRTASTQRIQSKEQMAANLGMTQAQNYKHKVQAKAHRRASSKHTNSQQQQYAQAQQQQQQHPAGAKGTGGRAGFAVTSEEGSDSSDEDEEEEEVIQGEGEGDDDEEWVSTAESGAATPNNPDSDSDTEVDAAPVKGAKLQGQSKPNTQAKGVLNAGQVDTQLRQEQQHQQQRETSREQRQRPETLKRTDTARAGDFAVVKPPELVPVLQQMQQPMIPLTRDREGRAQAAIAGAAAQHAMRQRGEPNVPVLQAPPAGQRSSGDRERNRIERETSLDSNSSRTTSTTTGRRRSSDKASAAPHGRQMGPPPNSAQPQPRPERSRKSRPASIVSTRSDGQQLRPHPLIRGQSFNAAASNATTASGSGASALLSGNAKPMGGASSAHSKQAPLAPLTVIPTTSEHPDVSASTPPTSAMSGLTTAKGHNFFPSSSPSSMKTVPTTSTTTSSPASDGPPDGDRNRRQSFSSQHSVTTIPVHSTIIREPAGHAQAQASVFGYPRSRTLSTMSTNSSSAALSALAQQLPSASAGLSSPHPSYAHHAPQSSASSVYSSTSHYPFSSHQTHPISTRPPSPVAPLLVSFFPPVNPYANVEGIHPLLPNPYLCNHLTVLSRRTPIRESWDRVIKAKRGVV